MSINTSNDYTHQFLRRKKVEEITTLSRNKIYSLMKEGNFPKSIAIAPKCVVWVKREIEEWIVAQVHSSRVESA